MLYMKQPILLYLPNEHRAATAPQLLVYLD